jgi:hypothetical protein
MYRVLDPCGPTARSDLPVFPPPVLLLPLASPRVPSGPSGVSLDPPGRVSSGALGVSWVLQ